MTADSTELSDAVRERLGGFCEHSFILTIAPSFLLCLNNIRCRQAGARGPELGGGNSSMDTWLALIILTSDPSGLPTNTEQTALIPDIASTKWPHMPEQSTAG